MRNTRAARPAALGAQLAFLVIFAILPQLAFAEPPPWAPANGYRHHKREAHEDEREYRSKEIAVQQNEAIVVDGRCNRDLVSRTFSDSTGNVVGSLIGGAIGGLIGNQFGHGSGKVAMTAVGAVAGILVGGAIGRSMDTTDQGCVGQTLEYAPDRQPVVWQNPGSGAQYQVTPVSTFEPQPGHYCREYTSQAVIGGRNEEVRGTACRQPDGSWQIQS
jgi:surface antigen